MAFVVLILLGAVVGVIARLLLRGRQNISWVETILAGIIGTLLGWGVARLFGVDATSGVDWLRWIISIIMSMIIIALFVWGKNFDNRRRTERQV